MKHLDAIEKSTYRWHVWASIFDGIFTALIWSAGDIARKGLDAGVLEVVLITMAPGSAMLFSLFVTGRMAGVGHKKLLLSGAILGRVPLLAVFFVDDAWTFLFLITLNALAWVPITAAWNGVLRSNYSDRVRGTLYGRASRYGALFAGVCIVSAGFWLSKNPEAYRLIYPAGGVAGVLACVLFTRIRVRSEHHSVVIPGRVDALSTIRDVLFKDRNFLRYEIGFFLYGVAFMAMITAKPLFVARPADGESGAPEIYNLDFDYDVLLGARGLYSLTMVLCTPYMGRLMDRIGPTRLAARAFGLLAVYAILLLVTRNELTYCLAEAFWGVAMAGVLIAWNMGPVTLAPQGDAVRYMGVHVALVGVRALIAHPLGGVITKLTGDPRWVFLIAILFCVAGSAVMWRLGRDLEQKPSLAM